MGTYVIVHPVQISGGGLSPCPIGIVIDTVGSNIDKKAS